MARWRTRLAARTGPNRDAGGMPPRTLGADGNGRTAGAVRVRFAGSDEVTVQVGERAPHVAGSLGSTDAVLAELNAQLAAAPVKIVELETFAALSAIAINALVTRIDPAVEVRLVVDRVEPPPRTGVDRWALELFDGMPAASASEREQKLAAGWPRAMGKRCLDEYNHVALHAGGKLGIRTLAQHVGAVFDGLERCRCAGADVDTAMWLFEISAAPALHPGWLRLMIDTGGRPLVDMRDAGQIAAALDAMTPAERAKGVLIRPGSP